MMILGLMAPCFAFMLLGVAGLQAPKIVHLASSQTGVLIPKCIANRRSFGCRAIAPRRMVAPATTMKLETAPDPERYGAALTTTALSVSGATAFGACINQFMGADKALQFFAGYLVELSLSVDNLFVFLLLFRFFQVRIDNVLDLLYQLSYACQTLHLSSAVHSFAPSKHACFTYFITGPFAVPTSCPVVGNPGCCDNASSIYRSW